MQQDEVTKVIEAAEAEEETGNITSNANISLTQQQRQHDNVKQQFKHSKQHSHHHEQRDVSEQQQQFQKQSAEEISDVIYESLPQALQQRMVFEETDYDEDDEEADDDDVGDSSYEESRSMDILSVDGNFNFDMQQPIKVLTLGGSNEDTAKNENTAQTMGEQNSKSNDAIKIISAPSELESSVEMHNYNNNKKTTESLTDFDALAPVSESSNSQKSAASNSKMVPVITPDGKVALLYREDAETFKESAATNEHKDNNNNNTKNIMPEDSAAAAEDDYDYDADDDDDDDVEDEVAANDKIIEKFNKSLNDAAAVRSQTQLEEARVAAAQAPTSTILVRPTDSILPMINRPLSEVLGIKKNQFKQFRIKDDATSTYPPSTSTAMNSRISTKGTTPLPQTAHALATGIVVVPHEVTLEMPHKVQEFDFSRDSTMLDERSRPITSGMNQNGAAQAVDTNELLRQTELMNLAILPHLEQELTRLQQEKRRHYHNRRKHKPRSEKELSSIHFVMQIMMGVAAVSTVFGMLGTFFKQRILDQLRMLH